MAAIYSNKIIFKIVLISCCRKSYGSILTQTRRFELKKKGNNSFTRFSIKPLNVVDV